MDAGGYLLRNKTAMTRAAAISYQCIKHESEQACLSSGYCLWIDGRGEVGSSDCTLCAGRTEDDCKNTGGSMSLHWDMEGFEGACLR